MKTKITVLATLIVVLTATGGYFGYYSVAVQPEETKKHTQMLNREKEAHANYEAGKQALLELDKKQDRLAERNKSLDLLLAEKEGFVE